MIADQRKILIFHMLFWEVYQENWSLLKFSNRTWNLVRFLSFFWVIQDIILNLRLLKFNFALAHIRMQYDQIIGKTIYFTPEV